VAAPAAAPTAAPEAAPVADCEDFPNWKDADGNGCDIYEDERCCAKFGKSENEEGISADEACCVCGGGDELSDEF
jgi:hypothetical protein